MNKKLQVFISSTYTDLIEERQAAVQAILDAGHIPAGMELFKAGKSQMKTIRKWIDESDVYMLILGGRYGSIEEESGLSYTELEYKYALSKNMPVFAIVLGDSFLHIKASSKDKYSIFEKNNVDKYDTFKKFVESNIVKFANNIDKISSIIYSHLNDILADDSYNLIGWVRYNSKETAVSNFESLQKTFDSIPMYIDNNSEKIYNANEYFIKKIRFYSIGVSKSWQKYIYRYYTHLYIINNILIKSQDPVSEEEVIKLSKLGFEYYNYLISKNYNIIED